MERSIGLWKSSTKTNLKHNNREQKEYENDLIDKSREKENKYLIKKNIKEIYEEEFGEALEKYNAKQKRRDRKIKDYYKHIEKGKKTAVQQEMIVQVGEGDDYEFGDKGWGQANQILEKYARDFEQRNPNLKVYNAVIHNDETTPHLHLNFVPVASGYKRGLEKQVAFDRAIKQQDKMFDVQHPFEAWRNSEIEYLTELLKEHGIERKLVGTNDIKDTNELKKVTAEREKLEKERELFEKERKAYFENINKNIESVESLDISYSHEEKVIEKYEEVEPSPLGRFGKDKVIVKEREIETGNVVFTPQQVESLERLIYNHESLGREYERLKGVLSDEMVLRGEQERKHEEELQTLRKEVNERAERLKDEKHKEIEKQNELMVSNLEKARVYFTDKYDELERGNAERDQRIKELESYLEKEKAESSKLSGQLADERNEYAELASAYENLEVERDEWKNKFEVLWENTKEYLNRFVPEEVKEMVGTVKAWFKEDTGHDLEPEKKNVKQHERDGGMNL